MHIDLEQYSTEYTVGKNVISISSKNLHFSKGVNPLLINSSNLQSFRIRFYARYTQKRQNVMGTILVAVKHLNIGVRGPGKKPSWGGGGTRSTGTGGSHPGLESRSQRHRIQIG